MHTTMNTMMTIHIILFLLLNMTQAVTNYQYEIKKEDDKRNIFYLKPEYLNVIFNDLDEIHAI